MQRNTILALALIVLSIAFWANLRFMIDGKPHRFQELEALQNDLNEQLISAQILANKLDEVYTLFDENLALSKQDSLAEDASLPFLRSLAETMNDIGIVLLNIRPKPREERGNYYVAPYDLIMRCSYEELGKFFAEIERSPRLITVKEFSVKNGIERIKGRVTEEDLKEQIVEMSLSTMTLVKKKTKVIS